MSTESAPTLPAGTSKAPIQISWSPEGDGEAGRDFIGIIVSGEYPYHDENSKFEGEQIRLMIRCTENLGGGAVYENLQPIWLPPSNKKGSKFTIWRNFLMEKCATAWREILPAVQQQSDPSAQILAFTTTLKGMQFRFQDQNFPRANAKKDDPMMRMLVPLEYKGRGTVTEVTSEKVTV